MARILFTVPPLTGHLNPALAVACVLAEQGHTIAWAVHAKQIGERLPPHDALYPLDNDEADFAKTFAAPPAKGLDSVRLFFEDYSPLLAKRALLPLEKAALAFAPDIMVVDQQMLAGALVARKLGLAWVGMVTTSATLLKMSPKLDAWVEEQYSEVQAAYLPAKQQVARPDLSPFNNLVFSIEKLLGSVHARLDAPCVFVGPAQAGYAQNKSRQAVDFPWEWLVPDKKKILVSLGTVSRDHETRFFEVILEAVKELDIQVVMVAPEALAKLAPANVLVRAYIPQLELLQQMDGVICHAGHNTVCETLAQGLPLIVAPIRDDQPRIANQVIEAGAGIFMRHGKVTAAAARVAIARLLSDKHLADNARQLSAALHAASGAVGAAKIIAALAETVVQRTPKYKCII